jgi:exoribonuclease R
MLLATKPMQLAQYFCTGEAPVMSTWRHYALAMDHYTHFTSPIRCVSVGNVVAAFSVCQLLSLHSVQQAAGGTRQWLAMDHCTHHTSPIRCVH